MHQLNTTRVLYQTSKYAPVAVLRLDITAPTETATRRQINEYLEQVDSSGFSALLSPTGEQSTAGIYCELVLGLQRSSGHSVQYHRTEELDGDGEYRVFVEYEEETTALYAAETAIDLLNDILQRQDKSRPQQSLNEFAAYAVPRRLDSNARLLIRAARSRGIPVMRPLLPTSPYASAAEVNNDEFLLGWGVHQQRCNGAISNKLMSMATLLQLSDRAKL